MLFFVIKNRPKLNDMIEHKNIWEIKNLSTGRISYFSIGTASLGQKLKRSKPRSKIIFQGGLTVLISVLIIFTVVKAGSITPPPGTPSAQFYTLSNIYTRLTTNATATVASHSFTFADSLASTSYTLTQIYNAIPTIDATKILANTSYLGVAGTMANRGAFSLIASSSNQSVAAGYYSSGTLVGDAYLVSGNIKSGVNIFGVAGSSNVVDTSTGDAAAGDIANDKIAFSAGSQITGSMFTNQKNQTRDDWVDSGGIVDEYTAEEATWSTVTGSPFSNISYLGGNLYSGAVKQDARTGLWWSDIMAIGAVASTSSNDFTLIADGARPTGGNAIGFCDALNAANFGGHNDWYLPTQKQLQQAYIDGSANNLPNPDYFFWSSSELSWVSSYAWYVSLTDGYTYFNTKVTSPNVRCVRP